MLVLVYLWRLWFLVLGILLTLSLGPLVYLLSFKKDHYKYCYFFIRLWALGMFYGMGFWYKYRVGKEQNLDPNKQYIFIANHTSVMDIMLMLVLHPKHPLCFVGKKDLVKVPIFGTIYRRIVVMVDRSDARSRAQVYPLAAERIRAGQNIMIFPEGLVPDDLSVVLAPFKNGAFVLSSQYNIPIAVYTFMGLKQKFPFNYSKGAPGCILVCFDGILYPNSSNSAEGLKKIAYDMIKNTLENQDLPL